MTLPNDGSPLLPPHYVPVVLPPTPPKPSPPPAGQDPWEDARQASRISSNVAIPLVTFLVILVVVLGSKLLPAPPAGQPATPTTRTTQHPITGAALGGPQIAFTDRYGGSFNGVYTGTVNGVDQVMIGISQMPAQDGSPHIYTVFVQPASGTPDWDLATATRVTIALVPTDSIYERDVSWPNGVEHVYTSVDLAASFPAVDFTNDAGTQAVPPGTFDWQCFENSSGTGISSCIISIGNR